MSVKSSLAGLCGESDDKLSILLPDLPLGPLDGYRQQSSFDWKRMRLFSFGYDALEFQVNITWWSVQLSWLPVIANYPLNNQLIKVRNQRAIHICAFTERKMHLRGVDQPIVGTSISSCLIDHCLISMTYKNLCQYGMLTTFPQCNFSLEFSEPLSWNPICYHRLSVSGISKIMRCGIFINMAYFWITQYMALHYIPTFSIMCCTYTHLIHLIM